MDSPSVPPRAEGWSDNAQATYFEVHSLALELCQAEGWMLGEAMRIAADDLGFHLTVPEAWDRPAFVDGNEDAMPF